MPARRAAAACLALGLAALAGPGAAQSADPGGSTLRFSGFGSLGLAHVDAPEGWVYRREVSQALEARQSRVDLDSRLGLQVNYAPSTSFELVAQANLRRRAPAAEDTDPIEWAFAAYRPHADWSLRLGRINLDAFLISDYRSVGFAYPYARPPVELYGAMPTSLDGADASRVWNDSSGQWRAKVFLGNAQVNFEQVNKLKLPGLLGGMVSREAGGLFTRVSLMWTPVDYVTPALQPLLAGLGNLAALPVPAVANQAADLRKRLELKDGKQLYLSFGTRYEMGDWVLSGELTRVTGPIAYSAGYVSVGWRVGPATIFGVASRQTSPSEPLAAPAWQAQLAPLVGPAVAAQAQFLGSASARAINGLSPRQSTFALGTRWDLGSQMALKVQWDHIRVAADGGTLWGRSTPQAARANVGTVVLDFVF
jgi:hypothetical protein